MRLAVSMSRLEATALLTTASAATAGYVLYQLYQRKARVQVQGKAVLITGCDSGFGHALALRLHELGLRVYAGCLDAATSPGAATLRAANITVLQLDVTEQQQVEHAISTIEQDERHILHAVVNNAGVVCFGEVELLPLSHVRRLMDVNYLGTVRVTQRCLPALRKHPGARVVNVTSLMGETALYNLSAYCASKFAVSAFSAVLRQEMRQWRVHVSTIQPGPYQTSIGVGDRAAYVEALWAGSRQDTQEDYGREYYTAYTACEFPCSPHIHEVVAAMEHAVLARRPHHTYRRGPGSVLLPWSTWLGLSLPVCIMRLYTFYTGARPSKLH